MDTFGNFCIFSPRTLPIALAIALSATAPAQEDPEPRVPIAKIAAALLESDPVIDADQISVRSKHNALALIGTVDSIRAARRAVRLAQSVAGVGAVVDQIVVMRHAPQGPAAARRVHDAIAADPRTAQCEVIVDDLPNGVVIVRTTQSGAVIAQLRDVAEGVAGVQRVEIEFTGELEREPSDEDLKAEVEARFARDVWLENATLQIAVNDGVIALSGMLDGVDLLARARQLASVPGSKGLDTTAIGVSKQPADPALRRSFPENVPDEALAQSLVHALELDSRVDHETIVVKAHGGILHLSGTALTQTAADAALRDAWNTLGVRDATSEIRVGTSDGHGGNGHHNDSGR